MTREEIKSTPELVDFMLDKCVLADSRTKVHKRLEEVCNLAIKALEQEPKFIAKSDGTIEQIKDCNDCVFRKEWEKIGKLISVILKKQTQQEPCEDCISRKAVLDLVEDMTDQFGVEHRVITEGVISMLPPVTPKSKTGHWIEKYHEVFKHYCDNCGTGSDLRTNFCPNCGFRMVEPQESEG